MLAARCVSAPHLQTLENTSDLAGMLRNVLWHLSPLALCPRRPICSSGWKWKMLHSSIGLDLCTRIIWKVSNNVQTQMKSVSLLKVTRFISPPVAKTSGKNIRWFLREWATKHKADTSFRSISSFFFFFFTFLSESHRFSSIVVV